MFLGPLHSTILIAHLNTTPFSWILILFGKNMHLLFLWANFLLCTQVKIKKCLLIGMITHIGYIGKII